MKISIRKSELGSQVWGFLYLTKYADAILDSFVCGNLQEKNNILILVLKVLKLIFFW